MSAQASAAPRVAADPQRLALAHSILGKAEAKTQRERDPRHKKWPAHEGRQFAVPEVLVALMPQGGVRAGSSIDITGPCKTSLALAFAAAAMGEESWCALVGMPHVGLAACADIGVDPQRTALIPAPGAHLSPVLSALIDGIDVVVLGADLDLTPAQWRAAKNRARTQGTLLIRVGKARCDLTVRSSASRWVGLSRGSGRLRFRNTHVSACGRGVAGAGSSVGVRVPTLAGALSSTPCTEFSAPYVSEAHTQARARLTLVRSGKQ